MSLASARTSPAPSTSPANRSDSSSPASSDSLQPLNYRKANKTAYTQTPPPHSDCPTPHTPRRSGAGKRPASYSSHPQTAHATAPPETAPAAHSPPLPSADHPRFRLQSLPGPSPHSPLPRAAQSQR